MNQIILIWVSATIAIGAMVTLFYFFRKEHKKRIWYEELFLKWQQTRRVDLVTNAGIIMDDIWKPKQWEDLKKLFPDHSNDELKRIWQEMENEYHGLPARDLNDFFKITDFTEINKHLLHPRQARDFANHVLRMHVTDTGLVVYSQAIEGAANLWSVEKGPKDTHKAILVWKEKL